MLLGMRQFIITAGHADLMALVTLYVFVIIFSDI